MKENNRITKIATLHDLHLEKSLLRNQILLKEKDLKVHYENILHQVNPILNISNFISGKKWFQGNNQKDKSDQRTNTGNSWFDSILTLISVATASGFAFKTSKKNFIKALLAYSMDQGLKFITQKDIAEHIENVKEWIHKNEKKKNDPDEEPKNEN